MLGLCHKKTDEVKQDKADPPCVMCEFVISLLTKRLSPNATKVNSNVLKRTKLHKNLNRNLLKLI